MPNIKWNLKDIFTSKGAEAKGSSDKTKESTSKGSEGTSGAKGGKGKGAEGIGIGRLLNKNGNRQVVTPAIVLYPPDFDDLVSCLVVYMM